MIALCIYNLPDEVLAQIKTLTQFLELLKSLTFKSLTSARVIKIL